MGMSSLLHSSSIPLLPSTPITMEVPLPNNQETLLPSILATELPPALSGLQLADWQTSVPGSQLAVQPTPAPGSHLEAWLTTAPRSQLTILVLCPARTPWTRVSHPCRHPPQESVTVEAQFLFLAVYCSYVSATFCFLCSTGPPARWPTFLQPCHQPPAQISSCWCLILHSTRLLFSYVIGLKSGPDYIASYQSGPAFSMGLQSFPQSDPTLSLTSGVVLPCCQSLARPPLVQPFPVTSRAFLPMLPTSWMVLSMTINLQNYSTCLSSHLFVLLNGNIQLYCLLVILQSGSMCLIVILTVLQSGSAHLVVLLACPPEWSSRRWWTSGQPSVNSIFHPDMLRSSALSPPGPHPDLLRLWVLPLRLGCLSRLWV